MFYNNEFCDFVVRISNVTLKINKVFKNYFPEVPGIEPQIFSSSDTGAAQVPMCTMIFLLAEAKCFETVELEKITIFYY